MTEPIDCRGLACPEPVLLVKRALLEYGFGKVTVLVSGKVARDNVSRAAARLGWSASVMETAGEYVLTLNR